MVFWQNLGRSPEPINAIVFSDGNEESDSPNDEETAHLCKHWWTYTFTFQNFRKTLNAFNNKFLSWMSMHLELCIAYFQYLKQHNIGILNIEGSADSVRNKFPRKNSLFNKIFIDASDIKYPIRICIDRPL